MWTENLGRAHRVAAAIEAGMCFVNSQNVRDLRQPFGGTKASGTGREGGTWSYEVFLEPKNVVRVARLAPHPALGRMSQSPVRRHHGQARTRRQDHPRAVDVPVASCDGPHKGCRQAAIDGHVEIGRRCRELGVDTIVVFDVHWLVNADYHINCAPQLRGRLHQQRAAALHQQHAVRVSRATRRSGELHRRDGERARASRRVAHEDTTLELEYGTLVPMRYMNADQHFKVVSVSALVHVARPERQRALRAAVRRAIEERYDGTVAVFASGSLSHRFADNGPRREYMHKICDPFLAADRPARGRDVEARRLADLPAPCCRCTTTKCYGEGGMHDTAMLLGVLGGERYDQGVEVITPYFGSSGTGQINAVFPVK